MTRLGIYISALLMACPALLSAQEEDNTLTLDAQLRSRGEYRNGVLIPHSEDEQPATFINERARLTMQYDRGDDLTLRIAAQHTGVYGQDPQIDKKGRLSLAEAWVGMKFAEGFYGRLGRQPLVYDDERLLGALDWNTAGRFHDAGMLKYKDQHNELHAVGAFNQNDERRSGNYYATGGQPYKTLAMLWYHYTSDLIPLGVSLTAMNIGFEDGDAETGKGHTSNLQTVGTFVSFRPQTWSVEASFYYQMGKRGTPTKAWMASVAARYDYSDEWQLSAGYDYLSGQDDDDYGQYNRGFNPLFGTHHKFYGSMDYFFSSPWGYMPRRYFETTQRQYNPGLQDLHASLVSRAIPVEGLVVRADYHYFASAAKLKGSIRGLGHEVDIQASVPLMKDVTLQGGYSFMLGQNTMDVVKGGSYKLWQDWAWLQFNVSTRLFSKKL